MVFSLSKTPLPPTSTLFPYTTLFRSRNQQTIQAGNAGSRGWLLKHASAEVSCRNRDRKSTRLNSSHVASSYAVFRLKKKRLSGASRGPVRYCRTEER